MAPLLGIEAPVAAARRACARLVAAPQSCTLPGDDGCGTALVKLYAELRRVRPELAPRRAAAADGLVQRVVDATLRLEIARDALARGDCDRIAPEGAHPTHVLLGGDARSMLVRPTTALRPGRRYALVVEGLDAGVLERLRQSVVPRPTPDGLAIPPGDFAGAVEEVLADDAGGIDTGRAVDLVRRLEREAAEMPGLGTFSGVRLTLPEPLRPEQLGELRIAFAPASRAPSDATVATFTTLDARAGLLAYRARLAELPCLDEPAEPRDQKKLLGAVKPHVATLVRGRYRSLDLGRATTGPEHALGVAAAAARTVTLPYLLALPRGPAPDTPVVIAVDGHAGSAARMLERHGDALAARGLAVLVVELPFHGARRVEGKDFLDPLDPAGLARNLRQATVDVLAAVRAVAGCGLLLPDGGRFRSEDVRYLGYSLGAMIGTMARSVEADLGTTALFAPGGDILGWLMLRVSPALGATYVTCLGGPGEGESCIPSGECERPGVCVVDPYLDRLHWTIALPYELAAAPGDPLSYATVRTGMASRGRLLIITAGEDAALHPLLATRLADAYGMRPVAPRRRRGPRSEMVQWPALGHELTDVAAVREQAYEFLESDGRRVLSSSAAAESSPPPGWYEIFGPARK